MFQSIIKWVFDLLKVKYPTSLKTDTAKKIDALLLSTNNSTHFKTQLCNIKDNDSSRSPDKGDSSIVYECKK